MIKNIFVFVVIVAALLLWRWYGMGSSGTNNPNNPMVTIHTTKGDIRLELFADKTPLTVKNFTDLASKGFYNDTLFHRVIPNFMIQGGDPNTRAGEPDTYGTGGPGYTIADEIVPDLHNVRGTIAMANTGQPHSGGSQFFINVVDNSTGHGASLDGGYTVFGKVVGGMDVADAISNVPRNERDVPLDPVRIDSIVVLQQ